MLRTGTPSHWRTELGVCTALFEEPGDVALCALPSTGAGSEDAGAATGAWHQPLRESDAATRQATRKMEANRTPARAGRVARRCRSIGIEQSLHRGAR